jgi:hypothetical protein
MKHLLVLATLSFVSFSSFADTTVTCQVEIRDNVVDCPLILPCPEKKLRESKITISEELLDGQSVEKTLHLNKVVLHPGTKKQDKHSVYLLPSDDRSVKLKEEKDIDLVEFEAPSQMTYQMSASGSDTQIQFRSGNSRYNFSMKNSFSGKLNGYIYVSSLNEKGQERSLPVYLSCSQINGLAQNESELQKEAVNKYLEEKKKGSSEQ